VVVDLARSPEGGCGITLSHLGWGRTPEWEALYQYFDRAWATVLIDSAKIGAA
jgi:hypothetical protein